LAFGTLIGLHDPMQFFEREADPIRTRFRADPAVLAAEANGELVGSNFIALWVL